MQTSEFVENLKSEFKEESEKILELQKLLKQLNPKTEEDIYYKFIASSTK